jgi:hypothetical protein
VELSKPAGIRSEALDITHPRCGNPLAKALSGFRVLFTVRPMQSTLHPGLNRYLTQDKNLSDILSTLRLGVSNNEFYLHGKDR